MGDNKVFVSSSSKSVSLNDFCTIFAKFGSIIDAVVHNRNGRAILTFSKAAQAAKAVEEMDGKCIKGSTKPLKVKIFEQQAVKIDQLEKAKQSKSIYIAVPTEYTRHDLNKIREVFHVYGTIVWIELFQDPDTAQCTGDAMIKFAKNSEAQYALEHCDSSYNAHWPVVTQMALNREKKQKRKEQRQRGYVRESPLSRSDYEVDSGHLGYGQRKPGYGDQHVSRPAQRKRVDSHKEQEPSAPDTSEGNADDTPMEINEPSEEDASLYAELPMQFTSKKAQREAEYFSTMENVGEEGNRDSGSGNIRQKQSQSSDRVFDNDRNPMQKKYLTQSDLADFQHASDEQNSSHHERKTGSGSRNFQQGQEGSGSGNFLRGQHRSASVNFQQEQKDSGSGNFLRVQQGSASGNFQQGQKGSGIRNFQQGQQGLASGNFQQGQRGLTSGNFRQGQQGSTSGNFRQGQQGSGVGNFQQGQTGSGSGNFRRGETDPGSGNFQQPQRQTSQRGFSNDDLHRGHSKLFQNMAQQGFGSGNFQQSQGANSQSSSGPVFGTVPESEVVVSEAIVRSVRELNEETQSSQAARISQMSEREAEINKKEKADAALYVLSEAMQEVKKKEVNEVFVEAQMPAHVTEQQTRQLFDCIPEMLSCKLNNKTNIARITYSTRQCAEYAVKKLDNYMYVDQKLRVTVGALSPVSVLSDTANVLKETVMALKQGKGGIQAMSAIMGSLKQITSQMSTTKAKVVTESTEMVPWCTVKVPPVKPMVGENSEVKERLFVMTSSVRHSEGPLKDIFCRFGNVIKIWFVQDKKYGFVHFANKASADNCKNTLHGAMVGGMELHIEYAERSSDPFYNPPSQEDEHPEDLTVDGQLDPRTNLYTLPWCSVPLPKRQKVYKPMAGDAPPQEYQVFVVAMPSQCSPTRLNNIFSRFGNFVNFRFQPGQRYGFARYVNYDNARKCVETLHGQQVDGKKLKVELGNIKNPSQQGIGSNTFASEFGSGLQGQENSGGDEGQGYGDQSYAGMAVCAGGPGLKGIWTGGDSGQDNEEFEDTKRQKMW